MKLWYVSVLLATLGLVLAEREQPVRDMLRRTIGPAADSVFELKITDLTARCGSSLCFTLSSSSATVTPRIQISATNEAELGYGAAYYLRKFCAMSFSWERAGGTNLKEFSKGEWPIVSGGTIIVKKAVKWTYYQNVCTESYSMWWWDWKRWEVELDWMNLQGINIALAYVGQEQIYSDVFSSFGVQADELRTKYFNGPAYLAWSRGQGVSAMGGPLPKGWMAYQVQLQVNITNRMRELGITPILSAFQGTSLM
jgi:alpha-N-acetylglucosaminidase